MNKNDTRLADWAIKKVETEYRDDVCLLLEHKTLKLEKDMDATTFSFYILQQTGQTDLQERSLSMEPATIISILSHRQDDYISLTDMAKYKNAEARERSHIIYEVNKFLLPHNCCSIIGKEGHKRTAHGNRGSVKHQCLKDINTAGNTAIDKDRYSVVRHLCHIIYTCKIQIPAPGPRSLPQQRLP